MTLFEYLATFVSIVLSFGVIRLLDGLPAAVQRGRRYAIHLTWVIAVLWTQVQFWWAFWSYNTGVAWNYPSFLLILASPFLLYSLAITLVPRDSGTVGSWRDHFYHVRARFYYLFACWFVAVGLGNWFVLDQPFLHPLRLFQGIFVTLFLTGVVSKRPWFHGLLVASFIAMLAFSVVFMFLEPAPLNS